MAAIEQETIDDIEFYHQSEEPIDAGPDDFIGCGQHIDIHHQLCHYMIPMEVETPRSDGIDHEKDGETHDEHAQEFEIMVAHKRQAAIQ